MGDFICTCVLFCISQHLAYKSVLLYNQRKENNTFLNLKDAKVIVTVHLF